MVHCVYTFCCVFLVLFVLRVHLLERSHKTEDESKTKRAFTRSQRTASLTEYSKSALTDHANQPIANHTIDWKKTTVIDREQDGLTRWIKEAVHIRKEGHRAMNRDEGSYQLRHA